MKRGFTLIELLVVVLIIGILASIALPQYRKAVLKTRMSHMVSAVKQLADAEQVFLAANGKYTPDRTNLDISFPGSDKKYPNASYRVQISKGYCGLEGISSESLRNADWVYCQLETNPRILLGMYLQTQVKRCCNYTPSNELGTQMCKQETKSTGPYSTSSTMICFHGKWE